MFFCYIDVKNKQLYFLQVLYKWEGKLYMRLAPLSLNTISYKSNNSVNTANSAQQPNESVQPRTITEEKSKKINYKKVALALAGVALVGVGLYKGKSILNGLKKATSQAEHSKPDIKPDIHNAETENLERTAETLKETLSQGKENVSEVVNAEVVYIPPKKSTNTSRRNKSNDIVVIDESGNILERRPNINTENKSQKTNPFDFQQKRRDSKEGVFDRTVDTIDDVTDAIILDDILFHGGSGLKGAMESVTENIKPNVIPEESGFFSGFGENLSNWGESISDSLHNLGEGFGDTFTNFTEGLGDTLGDALGNIGDNLGDIVDGIV